MKTYKEVEQFIEDGRDEYGRPVPNRTATRIEQRDETTIALKYHETDVVTYHADGSYTLDANGWQTKTTKRRINEFSPFNIIWREKVWFVSGPGIKDYVPFTSPMKIDPNARVTDWLEFTPKDHKRVQFQRSLGEAIVEYANELTDRLFDGEIHTPGPGGCEECAKLDYDREVENNNHLLQHITNGEYEPHFVSFILRQPQVSKMARGLGYGALTGDTRESFATKSAKRQIRYAIKRYMRTHLGVPA
ncbi:hypothetical protein GF373_17535 [bacterium]|nr:hypothetical protein [bacterium]